MSVIAGVGLSQGIDGREASVAAAQQALNQMGAVRPTVGLVFLSHVFNPAECLAALINSLPNTVLWGMMTQAVINATGEYLHSVAVILIGGSDVRASSYWKPEYSQNSESTARSLFSSLKSEAEGIEALLLAVDGISGDPAVVMRALHSLKIPIAGGMACNDISQAKTYQLSGVQSGSGALGALTLGGKIRLGCGSATGWKKTGLYYRVTQSRGAWIQELDGKTPAETYSQAFHFPVREWGFPPLKSMVRQYPLGLDIPGLPEILPHAPLHVEVDGRLRMNVPLQAGQVVHLLAGDPVAAPEAASRAARSALENLHGARPLAAIAFVDEAYHLLMQERLVDLYSALHNELTDIPLVAVYTLGQVVPVDEGGAVFVNSSISVAVLGVIE